VVVVVVVGVVAVAAFSCVAAGFFAVDIFGARVMLAGCIAMSARGGLGGLGGYTPAPILEITRRSLIDTQENKHEREKTERKEHPIEIALICDSNIEILTDGPVHNSVEKTDSLVGVI